MTGLRDDAERSRAEERLARLVGRVLEPRLPADDAAMAALLDWQARDARACQSPAVRAQGMRLARDFADALLARRAVERARRTIHCLDEPAAERRAAAVATAAQAVDAAAARACAPLLELSVAAGDGRDLWEQPCERWVTLPDALPRGRYVALGVRGDSMLPLLASGDVVLVRLGEHPAAGTLVVAHRPNDGYVVKQVEQVLPRRLALRSLNPAYAPFTLARRPGAVLGRVVARWRG